MEHINIFNYEVFYLDYLEGNLGEEETKLLLDFLRKHPELELLDDDLPQLTDFTARLTKEEKNQLKQTEETDVVTMENAPYFLIADAEGILSPAKKNELNAIVAGSPVLQREQALYNAVYLKPNLAIQYTDKAGLKQDRKIVFWPYIAGIAAAGLVAFFVLFPTNGSEKGSVIAGKETPKTELKEDNKKQLPLLDVEQNGGVQVATNPTNEEEKNAYPEKTPIQVASELPSSKNKAFSVGDLKQRQARRLVQEVDRTLATVTPKIVTPVAPVVRENPSDQALFGINDMKNPIEPLTDQLKKRISTDVDFRHAKPTKNKQGGFYLKIGKFEILRKTEKKS